MALVRRSRESAGWRRSEQPVQAGDGQGLRLQELRELRRASHLARGVTLRSGALLRLTIWGTARWDVFPQANDDRGPRWVIRGAP